MQIKSIGFIDGKEIKEFTLKSGNASASIINYGGIITKYIYDGVDVVLGYNTIEEYAKGSDYFGATVGRVCNRIDMGKFNLNGKSYQLSINDNTNSLHGGTNGFSKKVFDYEVKDRTLMLSYLSKDGEEGYPANLLVKVNFYLDENGLNVDFSAQADGDTICNLTNHSYFNLNGHGQGDTLLHKLYIDADYILPINQRFVPTGNKYSVDNTPFDFRNLTKIGHRIDQDNEQLKIAGGYDHAYYLNGKGVRKIATLIGDKTNIKLDVITDQVSVQFYGGNFLDNVNGKDDKIYGYRSAVCLEVQGCPNAINCPEYPSVVLRANEVYTSKLIYKLYKDWFFIYTSKKLWYTNLN